MHLLGFKQFGIYKSISIGCNKAIIRAAFIGKMVAQWLGSSCLLY